MADFSSFNEVEISALVTALEEVLDKHYHYPDDYGEQEKQVMAVMHARLYETARAKRIWWAR